MKRCSSTSVRYWSMICSLLLAGCASAPRSVEPHFSQEYFTSKGGQLRYKLPGGWLNATNDSPSANTIIWLVRSDFAATLSVKELKIDAETRLEINRRGLSRLAELTLALESSERGISVAQSPQILPLRNMNVCRYEYLIGYPTNRMRVLLVDTGVTVYEVQVLMTENIRGENTNEVAAAQDAFVQNLAW